jgi:hypothetical protein
MYKVVEIQANTVLYSEKTLFQTMSVNDAFKFCRRARAIHLVHGNTLERGIYVKDGLNEFVDMPLEYED